jgi:hypothetical protein
MTRTYLIIITLLISLFAFGDVQAQEKTDLEQLRTYQKECDAGDDAGWFNLDEIGACDALQKNPYPVSPGRWVGSARICC